MVHCVIAIHPRIGLVDWSPSRWSQLQPRRVDGGNVVSIVLEPAAYTSEEALPVSFIDAPWAGDRSIFWAT